MRSLIFLLLTAVLAAAHPRPHPHPHPHNHHHHHSGECMEIRSSSRDGRSLWISPEFNCIEGLRPPKEEIISKKICHSKARRYMLDFFKGDKIDSHKDNTLEEVKAKQEEFFAKCMVDRLDLEAADGSLDLEKFKKIIGKIDSSDISALLKVQTWLTICAMNSTGINATEQYLDMRTCARRMLGEHCSQQQELIQAYVQRGNEESVCANVSTVNEFAEVNKMFNMCRSEMVMQAAKDAKTGSAHGFMVHKGVLAQEMAAASICTMKKMHFYSEETDSFDDSAYADYVANFTGWEEIPEVLNDVIIAMESCKNEFIGDVATQLHRFMFCLKPKIVKICGFKSNVTQLLFPFVSVDTQKAAMEYLEEMMDMDDDDGIHGDIDDFGIHDHHHDDHYDDHYGYNVYDDEDDDDDDQEEMVDDGLIEMEPLMTANEGDADAVLMDADEKDDDKDDEKDDDKDDREMMESREDDAEDIMARMKKRKSKESSEETKDKSSNNKSKESIETKDMAKDSGESPETTEVADNMSDETTAGTINP